MVTETRVGLPCALRRRTHSKAVFYRNAEGILAVFRDFLCALRLRMRSRADFHRNAEGILAVSRDLPCAMRRRMHSRADFHRNAEDYGGAAVGGEGQRRLGGRGKRSRTGRSGDESHDGDCLTTLDGRRTAIRRSFAVERGTDVSDAATRRWSRRPSLPTRAAAANLTQ